MFKCSCQFPGRNRRPPRDPINVIISLGYTFLTKEVSLALESESFEMYLGFLHGIRYGRKSLPLAPTISPVTNLMPGFGKISNSFMQTSKTIRTSLSR